MTDPTRRFSSCVTNYVKYRPSYPAASIDAIAEVTTLPDHNVDFVTAGQAFHWFDRERVSVEFARIL